MKTYLESLVPCLAKNGSFKASYVRRAQAKAAAREGLQKYKVKLRPYYCETCHHFHLTKKQK